MQSEARLAVREVTVQFPAVRALDAVSLEFQRGEVHGIIGENGAGKSTLMRVLAGLQHPDSGETLANGKPVKLAGAKDALNHGIAMIHQELNLVDDLTVAENMYLGREPISAGLIDRKKMDADSVQFLEMVRAGFSPQTPLTELSLAQKQLVEIAKALSSEADVLIMDEPTAVLSDTETDALFSLVKKLSAEGKTVLYISHRLIEVELLCDRISVLRDGQFVCTKNRGEVSPHEMASLMVGREFEAQFPAKLPEPNSAPILEVSSVGDGSRIKEASFSLKPGEIVGLAGLMGAGRTELGEMIAGFRPRTEGSIELSGRQISPSSPKAAAQAGIVYVSEDRKDLGLHLDLSTTANATLANLKAIVGSFTNQKKEDERTLIWKERLHIRVGDIHAPVRTLSGGNQQKVSMAKQLDLGPKVLIADEPTRGVDVGGKAELYAVLHELAKEGLACLVISSELPELIGLCSRVLVMREGRIVGEVSGNDIAEEGIMVLAAGVSAA